MWIQKVDNKKFIAPGSKLIVESPPKNGEQKRVSDDTQAERSELIRG